jgi:hypothetical protein
MILHGCMETIKMGTIKLVILDIVICNFFHLPIFPSSLFWTRETSAKTFYCPSDGNMFGVRSTNKSFIVQFSVFRFPSREGWPFERPTPVLSKGRGMSKSG